MLAIMLITWKPGSSDDLLHLHIVIIPITKNFLFSSYSVIQIFIIKSDVCLLILCVHVFAGTDARTSIDVQIDPAVAAFPEEVEGWDRRKSVDGVPLERQISARFPTVITPSAQVQEVVGDDMSVQDAIEEVIGE